MSSTTLSFLIIQVFSDLSFTGNCVWYNEQQLLKDIKILTKRKTMPQVTWPQLKWPVKVLDILKAGGYGQKKEVVKRMQMEEIYDKAKKVEEMQKSLQELFYGTSEIFKS